MNPYSAPGKSTTSVGNSHTRSIIGPHTSTKKQDRQLAYMRKIKEAPKKAA